MRRQHVILWPASALLTGNGVAFILRVPGTEHGDWWSMNGWWIFAGTAAVSLLSKHLIQFRGGHVFNPSNFGLVLCFLLLGPEHADPLAFWWGPMSFWLALALAIIIAGGFADPAAAAAAAHRRHLLGHVRRQHRRDRGERPRHDRELAPRPGLRLVLLAHPRLLARDPRLPLLHDHRPEDDPRGPDGTPGLRGLDRIARGAAARPADDRVRLEGRRPLRPRDRLCRPARSCVLLARPPRRGRRACRRRGQLGASRRRSPAPSRSSACSSSPGSPPARAPRRRSCRPASGELRSRVTVVADAGDRADRPRDRAADRARPRRRPRERVGGAPRPRPRARDGRAPTAPAWPGCGGRSTAPGGAADVPRYAVERVRVTPRAGRRPGAAYRRRARVGNGRRAAGTSRPVRRDLRARAEGRPLPDHRRSAALGGGGARLAPAPTPRRRAAAGRRRAGRARLPACPRSGSGSRTRRTR